LATVISNDKLVKHAVEKYNFKVLAIGGSMEEQEALQQKPVSNLVEQTPEYTKKDNPKRRNDDNNEINSSSKDSLIESLLKKTDDMSSNFIKLQMKQEALEEEHKLEIQKVKEESYNEGLKAGKIQANKDNEANYSEGLTQFSSSVATLENSAKEYETALEGIKGELISAALDISKEVINIELNESSQKIAQVLSSELIKELQSASKITLKVNPKDHGYISEYVGSLDHIEVISDSAISEGGVIAISDAGNIDSQISKRFERVKKAALSE